MAQKPYYMAYENRYQKVYAAGIDRWGQAQDDEVLLLMLTEWVEENQLRGKRVIEFACGEGAGGEILSRLGCVYHGVDIAPSAIMKAKEALRPYPHAAVSLLDMVNDPITQEYDAALDMMGFHMLVLDADRRKYLKNAFSCLKCDAPMLFVRESYRVNASEDKIDSLEQWLAITGEDYTTPQPRIARQNGMEIEVSIPVVPARARTKEGYEREMNEAGFAVEQFVEMDISNAITHSATLFVRKRG